MTPQDLRLTERAEYVPICRTIEEGKEEKFLINLSAVEGGGGSGKKKKVSRRPRSSPLKSLIDKAPTHQVLPPTAVSRGPGLHQSKEPSPPCLCCSQCPFLDKRGSPPSLCKVGRLAGWQAGISETLITYVIFLLTTFRHSLELVHRRTKDKRLTYAYLVQKIDL